MGAGTTHGDEAIPEGQEVGFLSLRHIAFALPVILLHLGCGLVFLVGISPLAMAVFVASSTIQVVGITLGYHRLLAHRSFKTSRAFQFVLATFGVLAGQNGPLWWVGHHRHHHRHSDTESDTHSPLRSFFWGHMGWLFSTACIPVRRRLVADLARLPELVGLERYFYLVNAAYAALLYGAGELVGAWYPASGVSGFQFCVWGLAVSTVWVYHSIWSANSICHRFGFRRYPTPGPEPQQLHRVAADVRRRMAPQPPLLPEFGLPRLPVVGDRHQLHHPARAVALRHRVELAHALRPHPVRD